MAQSLTSIHELSRHSIEAITETALTYYLRQKRNDNLCGLVVGLFFFSESTRTRVGMQVAAARLGAASALIDKTKNQPVAHVAESISDTVKSIGNYFDALCVRSDELNFRRIKDQVDKPLINCGDGDNEHPVQALIDLATILHNFGRLDNITVKMIGNLRFSRAAHSFILALSKFSNVSVVAVSPKELKLPEAYRTVFTESGNKLVEKEGMEVENADVVYISGFPRHTPVGTFSLGTVYKYRINANQVGLMKKNAIVLCPLPRVDEIAPDLDANSHAHYFEQSEIGLFVRMAVLERCLK